jgi:hypothetical protein
MSARPAPIFTTGWLESRFAVLDIAIIVVVVREYRLWCRERTGVNPAH